MDPWTKATVHNGVTIITTTMATETLRRNLNTNRNKVWNCEVKNKVNYSRKVRANILGLLHFSTTVKDELNLFKNETATISWSELSRIGLKKFGRWWAIFNYGIYLEFTRNCLEREIFNMLMIWNDDCHSFCMKNVDCSWGHKIHYSFY